MNITNVYRKMINESLVLQSDLKDSLEEASVIPSRPTVKKAYNQVVDLEADDMEQFLFSMAAYFKGEGKDFVDVASHMLKAAQTFQSR